MTGNSNSADIGIIGGTGVYDPDVFEDIRDVKIYTPYGAPSQCVSVGRLAERKVAFIPRHGKDHSIPPHKINFRANIFALKQLGVKRIIAVSSVGSLREHLKPSEFVFPDQFIDRTKNRPDTFFDGGQVAHVSSADPFCPEIRAILSRSASTGSITAHDHATYICIEGPRFSTRVESRLFRQWNADIVGMTLYPEIILAREAQICYACVSMVTDYDAWAETAVSASEVSQVMKANVENAKKLVLQVIREIPAERHCKCGHALEGALL